MSKQMSRTNGTGGAMDSMRPAAHGDEHKKAHRIGAAFASAHGFSHEGGLGGSTAPGGTPGPENVQGAGCADNFES